MNKTFTFFYFTFVVLDLSISNRGLYRCKLRISSIEQIKKGVVSNQDTEGKKVVSVLYPVGTPVCLLVSLKKLSVMNNSSNHFREHVNNNKINNVNEVIHPWQY